MIETGQQLDPKTDPARCCRKPELWPEKDLAAWEAAITPSSGLFDESGAAADWKLSNRKSVLDAYGRWLTFLDRNGWLDPDLTPAERLTPERLLAFANELQLRDKVASNTLRNRIRDLAEALRVMAPEADLAVLMNLRARVRGRARPVRDKRLQIRPIWELWRLGQDLTERAERGERGRADWNATLFRDGLMILMLTCRPLRRTNFAELQIGQHLTRQQDVFVLALEGHETKNHRPYEQALPAVLTPVIERYLSHYRPQLLRQSQSPRLWINARGSPLPDTGVYEVVRSRTKAAFGTALSPHLVRDCAVTSMGETDPELVRLAPALLHHVDHRIAEKHYDQAKSGRAVDVWQEYVRTKRRAVRKDRKKQRECETT